MTAPDQYLDWLLRLDRIGSILDALHRFYDAPTEETSRHELATVHRLCPPAQ